jgi:hypothetical protein
MALRAGEGVAVALAFSAIVPAEGSGPAALANAEEAAGDGKDLGLDAVGEEAVVTDLDEVLGGDVLDEAVDEEEGGAAHDLLGSSVVVVGVEEVDMGAVVADDAHFPDDGAAGVAAAVADGVVDLLEAGSDMDPPVFLGDTDQEGVDPGGVLRVASKGGMAKKPLLLGASDLGENVLFPLASQIETANEGVDRGIDPVGAVEGESAAGGEDMEVGIELEVGPKAVTDDEETGEEGVAFVGHPGSVDAGEGFGYSGGEGEEGAGGGAVEGAEEDFLVDPDEMAKLLGEGEDKVTVGDIEDVAEEFLAPGVGAGGAAGGAERRLAAVGNQAGELAMGADQDVAAEGRGATGEHAGDGLASPGVGLVPSPGQVAFPVVMVLEDGGDGNGAGEDLHALKGTPLEVRGGEAAPLEAFRSKRGGLSPEGPKRSGGVAKRLAKAPRGGHLPLNQRKRCSLVADPRKR